ncbi:MAG: hypothetical protein JNK45_32480, partial [Myxococcales bacterium]|nr:hypothetical protein [Myxococcales bacterium]
MPLTTRVTTTTSLLAALIVPACSPTAGVVGDGSFGVPETDTSPDGSSTEGSGGGSTSPDPSGSSSGAPSSMTLDDGTTAGVIYDVGNFDVPELPPGTCECAPHTDLIMLLTLGSSLLTFDPETLEFDTLVDQIEMTDGGPVVMPYSIAISRSGQAWVQSNLTPGEPPGTMGLCVLDINNPEEGCSIDPEYPGFGWDINGSTPGVLGLGNYGTAFVTRDSPEEDEPCEDLFAHSYRTTVEEGDDLGDLARMDFATMRLEGLAHTDYGRGELTGTGDGRLFAFSGAEPAKLVEYDKTTGAVIATTPLPEIELTGRWALAFWGGDFYFFTDSQTSGTSQVTKYDYDGDKSIEVIVGESPMPIIGAGTST